MVNDGGFFFTPFFLHFFFTLFFFTISILTSAYRRGSRGRLVYFWITFFPIFGFRIRMEHTDTFCVFFRAFSLLAIGGKSN